MNSKASWTPGKWAVVDPDSGGWCVQSINMTTESRNGGFVSAVCPGPDGKANAQLIALAPEMAEALRKVTLYAEAMERALGQDSPRNVTLDEARSILSRLPVSQ